MRVDRKYSKLTAVASKDQSRFVIMGLHIHRKSDKEGYIEATDGRRLVRCPVEFEKDDALPVVGEGVVISREFFERAIKGSPKGLPILMRIHEKTASTLSGVVMPLIDATYPNTDQVIPKTPEMGKPYAKITFNPKLLAEMVAALDKDADCVTLLVNAENNHEPLILSTTGKDEVAILMPIRNLKCYLLGTPVITDNGALSRLVKVGDAYRLEPIRIAPAPVPEVTPAPEATPAPTEDKP